MATNIKHQVKTLVEKQQLSSEQLSRLQGSNYSPWTWQRYAAVVATLLLFPLIYLFNTLPNNPVSSEQLASMIALEVANNHISMKPLEVQTDSIQDIRQYFSQLAFSPISSGKISSQKQLLGARYCSIQGITAAQIRYQQGQADHKTTLYQVAYDEAVFQALKLRVDSSPMVIPARGLTVKLWQEQGLLMAEVYAQ
ncbi:hypothetical protein SIN8267_02439 [Sinobacterium norvegicum]|uniref:Uncharacterized protein n=1 Tax=Sinobacterium norvegicum TaxID=1641715 RepID=A0ABN8EKQ8_9GAMM|nr:hypothetical protein [Sinobacterium norvegicum]CAH0992320.1 hypothetical protein SIN8267_02439 [Sinobacterium norvegicum]